MDRRLDRGHATRQHIVEVATRLFTEQGYEAVSVESLLLACGISKGALYHHFKGKESVFVAVLEATEEKIVAALASAAQNAADPAAALQAGADAWLDLAARDATVRRVVLLDAPGAIGWQAWRALDERYTLGLIRAALQAALPQMVDAEIDVRAHLLLAVLVEAALFIARAPDDHQVREAAVAAVDRAAKAIAGERPN